MNGTAAATLFGARLPLAESFAELLATSAVERGLIGPREVPRLWDRHILNCAVVQELIPSGADVADVGSGAGLPGLVLAIARPDLRIALIEPMLRRATWLGEAVARLDLAGVEILRDRAETLAGSKRRFDLVTARAVAPLPKLVALCLPLLRVRGVLLAMKGASASDELLSAEPGLRAIGASSWSLVMCGSGLLASPTTVAKIQTGG